MSITGIDFGEFCTVKYGELAKRMAEEINPLPPTSNLEAGNEVAGGEGPDNGYPFFPVRDFAFSSFLFGSTSTVQEGVEITGSFSLGSPAGCAVSNGGTAKRTALSTFSAYHTLGLLGSCVSLEERICLYEVLAAAIVFEENRASRMREARGLASPAAPRELFVSDEVVAGILMAYACSLDLSLERAFSPRNLTEQPIVDFPLADRTLAEEIALTIEKDGLPPTTGFSEFVIEKVLGAESLPSWTLDMENEEEARERALTKLIVTTIVTNGTLETYKGTDKPIFRPVTLRDCVEVAMLSGWKINAKVEKECFLEGEAGTRSINRSCERGQNGVLSIDDDEVRTLLSTFISYFRYGNAAGYGDAGVRAYLSTDKRITEASFMASIGILEAAKFFTSSLLPDHTPVRATMLQVADGVASVQDSFFTADLGKQHKSPTARVSCLYRASALDGFLGDLPNARDLVASRVTESFPEAKARLAAKSFFDAINHPLEEFASRPFVRSIRSKGENIVDPRAVLERAVAGVKHKGTLGGESQESVSFVEGDAATRFNEAPDTQLLCSVAEDLTEKMRVNPSSIIGRDKLVEEMILTLCRKSKSNPLLLGKAGVGKTAAVEALALRIINEDVPEQLVGRKVMLLPELSSYSSQTIVELFAEASASRAILFLDEAHSLLDKKIFGGQSTANALKPLLARGDISLIAATTETEYLQTIKKDKALDRRFSPVYVDEMTEGEALSVLQGVKEGYESHHRVEASDECLAETVRLASIYMKTKSFPDKALDVLDMALSIAVKENKHTAGKEEAINAVEVLLNDASLSRKMNNIEALRSIGGIGQASKTIFPSVIGQSKAKKEVMKSLFLHSVELSRPNATSRLRDIIVLAGEEGCGKSTMAKDLSVFLTGNENSLLELDMSRFGEKWGTSMLMGSAPGYIGSDKGGILVDFASVHPDGVVVLENIGACGNEVKSLVASIIDDGVVLSPTGMEVDFSGVTFIFTSRVKMEKKTALGFAFDERGQNEELQEAVEGELEEEMGEELFSRAGCVAVFEKLSVEDYRLMAVAEYERLSGQNAPDEIKDLAVREFEAGKSPRHLKKKVGEVLAEALFTSVMEGCEAL